MANPMKRGSSRAPIFALAMGLIVALAGCSNTSNERALQAQQALIGMPKAQLLSCAGVPDRSRVEAGAEYFTYENERVYGGSGATVGVFGGSGHVGTGFSVPLATQLQSEYCEATFTLVDGRVVELVYNTSRGGRYAECARIVETCLMSANVPPPQ